MNLIDKIKIQNLYKNSQLIKKTELIIKQPCFLSNLRILTNFSGNFELWQYTKAFYDTRRHFYKINKINTHNNSTRQTLLYFQFYPENCRTRIKTGSVPINDEEETTSGGRSRRKAAQGSKAPRFNWHPLIGNYQAYPLVETWRKRLKAVYTGWRDPVATVPNTTAAGRKVHVGLQRSGTHSAGVHM